MSSCICSKQYPPLVEALPSSIEKGVDEGIGGKTFPLAAPPEEGPMAADFIVHGGGTVYVRRPTSPTGMAWIEEHIEPGALWF